MRAWVLAIGLLLASLALGQENPMPTPFLSSKASLAMRNDVRQILMLTGEQVGRIQHEIDSLGSVPLNGASGGSLIVFEQLDSAVRPILSEDQWRRLVQLWMQFEGPFVVQSAEIRDQLKLSPEILTRVDALVKEFAGWWSKEIPRVRKSSDLARIRNEARKTGKKLLALLTGEQKKQFEEMQGPKFKFRG